MAKTRNFGKAIAVQFSHVIFLIPGLFLLSISSSVFHQFQKK